MSTKILKVCDGPDCKRESKVNATFDSWLNVRIRQSHEEESKSYDFCSYYCMTRYANGVSHDRPNTD